MDFYKSSKYNYISKLDNGNICLYNSIKGISNICIVENEMKETVMQILSDENLIEDNTDSLIKLLISKGFLININENETARCNILQSEIVFNGYLHLVIHVTQSCNFRCSYCFLNHKPIKMSKEIQNDIIRYVKNNISNFKGVNVSWFGGEPLVAMDVIENISKGIMNICKCVKKPYRADITTNGYLLTPKIIAKLQELSVCDYVITIDGTEDIHNSMRFLKNGKPTFNKIITNLEYIRDFNSSRAISITIRTNITKKIIDELDDFYTFLDKKFGDDSRFSLLIKPVSDWGGDGIKKLYGTLIDNDEMAEVYKLISKKNMKLKFWGNILNLEVGGMTCDACWKNKITIGTDGLISKCDTCSPELMVGKIDSNHFKIDEYKFADWSNQIFRYNDKCNNCNLAGICFKGFCPKDVLIGKKSCCMNTKELDGLLQLAVYTVEKEKNICRIMKK